MVTSSIKKYRKDTIGSFVDHLLSSASCVIDDRIFDCIVKSACNNMLIRPWFICAIILAITHQFTQKVLDIQISMFDSFLDPLLFIPILLHLILWEQRFMFGKGPYYVLSGTQIISILVLVSVLCEYGFPRWSGAFTSDYLDIVCYSAGAFIFGNWLNSPLKTMR